MMRLLTDFRYPFVLGDEFKLTRIAMNLPSNAKKFTYGGGKVTFGINEKNYNRKSGLLPVCA